jgi:DNA-binding response OmpR family regulator
MAGELILVVEDDPTTLLTLADFLRFRGYRVASCSSGSKAVELMNSNPPTAMIIDWILPDRSGVDLCRHARKLNFNGPILIYTAQTGDDLEIDAHASGATHFLSKPSPMVLIAAKVGSAIRNSKSRAFVSDRFPIGTGYFDHRKMIISGVGGELKLNAKTTAMMRLLLLREGEVVSRDDFIVACWNSATKPGLRTVDNFVCKLRQDLRKIFGQTVRIDTSSSVGYCLAWSTGKT